MPYCTKCGAKIDENALFCTSCGEKQAKIYYPAPGAENNAYSKPEQAAPTYGGYTQSYDPTLYSAPAAGAYATQSAKKKSSGGKIAIIILAALLVIGLLVFAATKLLPAGGSDVDESLLGVYSVQKAKAYGIEVDATTLWKKGFDIELKKNGRCLVNVDGNKGSGKWTLDGSDFSLKASDLELNGSLYDGIIRIDNAMDMGVTLYFTKDGAALPSTSLPVTVEPAATPAPESPAALTEAELLGVYYADKAVYLGVNVSVSDVLDYDFAIELLADGKCSLIVDQTKGTGTWTVDGDKISVQTEGLELSGVIEDGMLKFENFILDGMTMYFTKG